MQLRRETVIHMQAHILEAHKPKTQPTAPAIADHAATPVGTFAAGQSPQGSFHVASEAELGSFASGVAADDDARTTE
jgi:hypothetical protein